MSIMMNDDDLIAVIDTETTGLYLGVDRVIEVGVVLMEQDGNIVKTYDTLINPHRDLGPTHIHNISAAEILLAPTFDKIAGDLLGILSQASIIAGHNVLFDIRGLNKEYERLGVKFDMSNYLCTYSIFREKLTECCDLYDLEVSQQLHSALGDALATSQLIKMVIQQGDVDLKKHCYANQLPSLPSFATPVLKRSEAKRAINIKSGFLSRITNEAMKYSYDSDSSDHEEYLYLLHSSLEDRILEKHEEYQLRILVRELGMDADAVHSLHVSFLRNVVIEALSDQIITEYEQNDLLSLTRLLDLDKSDLERLIKECSSSELTENKSKDILKNDLIGKSVCFTGTIMSHINGERMTKDIAQSISETSGLLPQKSVTKNLDILVVADPHTQSGKAKQARNYGTRIISERDFWAQLGVAIT
jgi:DNA polymerase-3 subunit epsilon